MEPKQEQQVEVRRAVRYGRLMIGGAVVGALVAVLITVLFPLAPGAIYTLGQISGFMLLIGAVIGLGCGAVLGLLLNLLVRKKTGTATAFWRQDS